jgi:hypothetical protein
MTDAHCVNTDHKIFISHNSADIQAAKKICMKCPVKLPCMEQYFDIACVAGGLSYYERLIGSWKAIKDINDSNWRQPNFLLRKYSGKSQ